MKYLYYGKGSDRNPVIGTIKKKNSNQIVTEEYLDVEDYFKLKETNEYEIIEIQTLGLYYKPSKYSKKRIPLHGKVNLFKYENGGGWETLSIKEQLEQYIKENTD